MNEAWERNLLDRVLLKVRLVALHGVHLLQEALYEDGVLLVLSVFHVDWLLLLDRLLLLLDRLLWRHGVLGGTRGTEWSVVFAGGCTVGLRLLGVEARIVRRS